MMFSTNKENAFQILGIGENCTDEEVKDAYMKLAKQWHPDVNKNKDATLKFQSISQAFEQLKSETARMKYTSKLHANNYSNFAQWSAGTTADHNEFQRNYDKAWSKHIPSKWRNISLFIFLPGMTILFAMSMYSNRQASHPLTLDPTLGKNTGKNGSMVDAWYNSRNKRWETPAPWDPKYKEFISKSSLKQVDKRMVYDSSRSR